MDFLGFKQQYTKQELGITDEYGRIFTFIDFGNVNHWFEEDRQDYDNNSLTKDEKLRIDIRKLKEFTALFSEDTRFYYGHDRQNPKSLGFIRAARDIYGKHRVFTKQIQKIRHYLTEEEITSNTRKIYSDGDGTYIHIPKCNFDVEIAVDAIKLSSRYDSFCLFSSDADFVHLARFLKGCKKRIILVKGGHIIYQWKAVSDVRVNAQKIKKYIAVIKQKPGG